MDRTFQTQMAESFYNDFALRESGLWDDQEHSITELTTFLSNFMTQLSMEDVDYYRSLHDLSRHSQYSFAYYLIEDFIKEQYPETTIFESDEDEFLLTEDPILATGAMVGGAVVAGLLGSKIWSAQRGNIHRTATKSIVGLFKYTKEKFDMIKKKTAKARAIDAIIYSNLDKCGAKCGIGGAVNQKQLSKYIEYPVTDKKLDKQAIEQFSCLLKCYLEMNIRAGSTLYDQFRACTNVRLERSMEMYVNQPENIAANCMDLYEAMTKHFSLYKDVVESLPSLSAPQKQQLTVAYFKGEAAIRSFNM